MFVRPPYSTFTGCVASVDLECVWTAIGYAGTGRGRVSHYGIFTGLLKVN